MKYTFKEESVLSLNVLRDHVEDIKIYLMKYPENVLGINLHSSLLKFHNFSRLRIYTLCLIYG